MAIFPPPFDPNQQTPNGPFYYVETWSLAGPLGPLVIGSGLNVSLTGVLSATGGGGGGGITSLSAGAGISLTPDPITTTGSVALATSGVTSGSYTLANITVDAYGRVTAASSGTAPVTSVSVASPAVNTGTAAAPIIGVQVATAGQLGAVQVGTNINVAAGVISVPSASTTTAGIVQLNNTVASNSTTEALTAAQGLALQTQIDNLSVASGLTLAGTFDAATGQVLTVTSSGSTAGLTIGADLPAPAVGLTDYFVIVTTTGTYDPPGPGGPYTANQGDWFLCDGTAWEFLNVGTDLPVASTGTAGIVELADNTETQTGTDTTRAVTPASAAATYVPLADLTGKGALVSASAALTPETLPVGSDGQILTACAATASGLCWLTPAPSADIPCALLTAKGQIIVADSTPDPVALPVGADGLVLTACSAAATGLCWAAGGGGGGGSPATPTVEGTVYGCVEPGGGEGGSPGFTTFLGYEAGFCTATANPASSYANTAIGWRALYSNQCSFDNVAIGVGAMYSHGAVGLGGMRNVAIGTDAMYFGDTYACNVAVGYRAGRGNSGNWGCNVLVGALAGLSISGYNNVLVGYCAGMTGLGIDNTAVGVGTLSSGSSGTFNVAVGSCALRGGGAGNCNTAIGYRAGCNISSGTNNTAIGNGALASSNGAANEITLGNSSIQFIRAAVTSITALSDARDKTDITALPVGLDFVNSLNPVKFTWKMREENEVKDGTSEAGFIAQELKFAEEAAGADYLGLVFDGNPDRLEASPGKLIPVLVKAIQELSAKVAELEKKV